MSNPDDEDDELFFDHLIDDSVAADPQPSQAGEFTFQDASSIGLLSKTVDGLDERDSVVFL